MDFNEVALQLTLSTFHWNGTEERSKSIKERADIVAEYYNEIYNKIVANVTDD